MDAGKAVGTEGGACYPNKTCNAGLICKGGVCVKEQTKDIGLDAPRTDGPGKDMRRDAPIDTTPPVDKTSPVDIKVDQSLPDASLTPPTWSVMPALTKESLRAVWGSGPDDVYIVGNGGTILYHDGRKPTGFPWWTAMKSNVNNTFYGVWGPREKDVVAVGNGGMALHYDGLTWTKADTKTNRTLLSVWGSGPINIIATDTDGNLRRTRRAQSPPVWQEDKPITPPKRLEAIWGTSATNVYAVGQGGVILYSNGTTWKEMITTNKETLYGVWGDGKGKVYAVGEKGTILQYNSSGWKQMMSNSTERLHGIWGSNSSDIFAVGEKGTILRYNGTGWAAMTSGVTLALRGVWGSAFNDVFVVGDGGTILHYGPCDCIINKNCYKAGDRDDTGCKACQPAKSTSTLSSFKGDCAVASKCYRKGERDITRCKICDPTKSATALSTIPSTCFIGGQCTKDGAAGQVLCHVCSTTKSTSTWSTKAGTCDIASVCYDKGNKDPPACSTCDPAKSQTAWSVISNQCKINSKCYAKGVKHPDTCAECDPTAAATSWTVKGTTHCLISDKCETSGTKDPQGCKHCDPLKNKYDWVQIPKLCTINGKCISNGTKHPHACAECDASSSVFGWTVKGTTHCLINNGCETAGTKDGTGCKHCDPATNKYDWSQITSLCLISNKCQSKGDKHHQGCAECAPATSTSTWTVTGTTHCLIGDQCIASGTKNTEPNSCDSCQPTKAKYAYYPDAGSCFIAGTCYKAGDKLPGGCATCAPATSQTKWTPTSASVCVLNGQCATVCSSKCVDTSANAAHCGKCNNTCASGLYCVAGKCSKAALSCAHHKAATPTAKSGLYAVAPAGSSGFSTYCDMVTDGGGWTLVMRTVWDWNQTKLLQSDFSTFYNTTLGKVSGAWRAAGNHWITWSSKKELMARLVIRKVDGSSCSPLYFTGDKGTFSANPATKQFKLDGLVSKQLNLAYSNELSTTDSGPSKSCVSGLGGVPWFYANCCTICPSHKGNYFPDAPHPMASGLAATKDLFGKVSADVCGTAAVVETGGNLGLSAVEFYVR